MNAANGFDQFLLWFLVAITLLIMAGIAIEPFIRRARYFWSLRMRRERVIPPLSARRTGA
jgi:heme exporter protein D